LAQISTKSVSSWGFAPDPSGETHSASQGPDPLAGKKGKEGEGEEKGGRGRRGREGRKGRLPPLKFKSGYTFD